MFFVIFADCYTEGRFIGVPCTFVEESEAICQDIEARHIWGDDYEFVKLITPDEIGQYMTDDLWIEVFPGADAYI